MPHTVRVQVNNAALAMVLGVSPEAVVNVECRNGVPLSREWRNRFKDAEIDGCVTVLADKPKGKTNPKQEAE